MPGCPIDGLLPASILRARLCEGRKVEPRAVEGVQIDLPGDPRPPATVVILPDDPGPAPELWWEQDAPQPKALAGESAFQISVVKLERGVDDRPAAVVRLHQRQEGLDLLHHICDSRAVPAGAHVLRIDDMRQRLRIARDRRDEIL